MKKIVLAAALVALSSGAAHAATANGAASATVVAPISVTHDALTSLNFGTFLVGASGGSVAVDAAGAGSVSGTVVFLSGSTNSVDAFDVAGDGTRGYTISTAGGTMGGMSFSTTPSAATGALVAGVGSFTVSGTLTVPSGQAAGAYTGSYVATVNYQ